jgi:hypothetical protein
LSRDIGTSVIGGDAVKMGLIKESAAFPRP